MARPGFKLRPGQMGVYINPADIIRATKTIMRSRNVLLDVVQAKLIKVTQQIKHESREIVPFKTGALKRSAYKFVNRRANKVEAEVGYDRYGEIGYAFKRHQVRARNYTTSGTDYLYLLRAFDKYADNLADSIAVAARKRFRMSSSIGSTQVWSED